MKLKTQMVEKPWGRDDIAPAFGAPAGKRIGEIWYDADGVSLPLMVKWLFTSQKLSVQVHPDDAQAHLRGLPSGKEECWYIVSAEPDAVLGIGTKIPMDAAQLRDAALSGDIEHLMDWKPVQAGDYYYIPAGTVHAIGPGITLVEVQQNADITYRLYDYKRLDNGKLRPLHLDDAVSVANAQPYCDPRSGQALQSQQIVGGPHFRLWLVDSPDALAALPETENSWLIPLCEEITLDGQSASMGDCLYRTGNAPVIMGKNARLLVAAV